MDHAATEEERDGLAACLKLLGKVTTVQGLDDIDAMFRHIMDITVRWTPAQNATREMQQLYGLMHTSGAFETLSMLPQSPADPYR